MSKHVNGLRFIALCIVAVIVMFQYDPSGYREPVKPHAEGSPAAMAEENDCWTGSAPADMVGKIPGHVLVTKPNGKRVVGGPVLVGKALDQQFAGEDHGLIIHGFCR